VEVLDEVPWVSDIAGRHGVQIGGFTLSEDGRRLVLVSTLDNLLKGAATQALQNSTWPSAWTSWLAFHIRGRRREHAALAEGRRAGGRAHPALPRRQRHRRRPRAVRLRPARQPGAREGSPTSASCAPTRSRRCARSLACWRRTGPDGSFVLDERYEDWAFGDRARLVERLGRHRPPHPHRPQPQRPGAGGYAPVPARRAGDAASHCKAIAAVTLRRAEADGALPLPATRTCSARW
jgi:hypothetical protein